MAYEEFNNLEARQRRVAKFWDRVSARAAIEAGRTGLSEDTLSRLWWFAESRSDAITTEQRDAAKALRAADLAARRAYIESLWKASLARRPAGQR